MSQPSLVKLVISFGDHPKQHYSCSQKCTEVWWWTQISKGWKQVTVHVEDTNADSNLETQRNSRAFGDKGRISCCGSSHVKSKLGKYLFPILEAFWGGSCLKREYVALTECYPWWFWRLKLRLSVSSTVLWITGDRTHSPKLHRTRTGGGVGMKEETFSIFPVSEASKSWPLCQHQYNSLDKSLLVFLCLFGD